MSAHLEDALTMARAGFHVFPVDTVTKAPPSGFLWKALASDRVNDTVDAFTAADLEFDQTSVAWACGIDGVVVLDLDAAEPPPFWAELKEAGAIDYRTRRGEHLAFLFPDEMTPSNSTRNFPVTLQRGRDDPGWGEVRGVGGYVVTHGPDRPGLDVGRLKKLVPFPRREWLVEAGDSADTVTRAEVEAFFDEHNDKLGNKLGGLERMLSTVRLGARKSNGRASWPGSIHDCGRDIACMIAREAAAGLYPARDGFGLFVQWWDAQWERRKRLPPPSVLGQAPPRMKPTAGEGSGLMRWGIAVALDNPEDVWRVRERAEREFEEWKFHQRILKNEARAEWIAGCSR